MVDKRDKIITEFKVEGIDDVVKGLASTERAVESIVRANAQSIREINKGIAAAGGKVSKNQADAMESVANSSQLVTDAMAGIRAIVAGLNKLLDKNVKAADAAGAAYISAAGGLVQFSIAARGLSRILNAMGLTSLASIFTGVSSGASAAAGTLKVVGAAGTAATFTLGAMAAALGAVVIGFGVAILEAKIMIGVFNLLKKAVQLVVQLLVQLAGAAIRAGIAALGKVINALVAPFRNAADSIKTFFNRVLAVTTGVLIRDAVFGIMEAIKSLSKSASDAAATFQTLELRLRGLYMRTIKMIDANMDNTAALNLASKASAALLEWVKKLSLIAPVSVDDIANTTAYAMAMGFAGQQVQDVTTAVITYAAAMGLGTDITEKMIFNFGQMKLAGKVTATEMRDLARGAFFPLKEVLDEVAVILGIDAKAFQEMRKEASEGAIDIDTFFEAFQRVVARDFPTALKDMGRTIQGVTTRMGNFFRIIVGAEVLGPTFAMIASQVADALDNLMSPAVFKAAHLIGEVLKMAVYNVQIAFLQLKPSLLRLAQAFGIADISAHSFAVGIMVVSVALGRMVRYAGDVIDKFAVWISANFRTLARAAAEWGKNIILALARGMAQAAAAVAAVIRAIAQIIASLLRAHSAPEILPDLPKWGMAAMTAWLEGFTDADFSVLEGIQDPLKDALNILLDTGQISKEQFGQLFRDISLGIAEAMAGAGTLPQSLLDQIISAGGPFGQEIADLALLQIQLAGATDELAAAEKRLEDARKAQEDTRSTLTEQTIEYNELLRSGADEAALQAKLEQINASEEAAQAAYEETQAAEGGLTAAEEQVKVYEDLVKLQAQLLQQLIEIMQAQIIQPVVDVGDLGGGGGAGGGGGGEEPEIGDLLGGLPSPEDVAAEVARIFEEARGILNRMFATSQWVPLIQGGQLTWIEEPTALGQFLIDMKTAWGELVTAFEGAQTTLEGTSLSLGNISNALGTALPKLTEFINKLTATGPPTIMGGQFTPGKSQLELFMQAVIDLADKSGKGLATLAGVVEDTGTRINNAGILLKIFFEGPDSALKIIGALVDIFITDMTQWGGDALQGFIDGLTSEAMVQQLLIGVVGLGPVSVLGRLIEGVIGFLGMGSPSTVFEVFGADTVLGFIKGITDKTQDLIDSFIGDVGVITKTISAVKTFLGMFGGVSPFQVLGESMILGMKDGVIAKTRELINAVIKAIKDAITAANAELERGSPSKVFMRIGQDVTLGMAQGVLNAAGAMVGAVAALTTMAANQAMQPAAATVAAPSVYRTSSVSFGDTYISSNMDGALYMEQVRQQTIRMLGV